MKSRETALRLKRFEVDEKSRKVADLEYMIRDFEAMASDLERQVIAEEERSGIKDPEHFSYSTYAKSASQRRENLLSSADELRDKLSAAESDRDDALDGLTKAVAAENRDDNQGPRLATAGPSPMHR